jgi:hypothetical protein
LVGPFSEAIEVLRASPISDRLIVHRELLIPGRGYGGTGVPTDTSGCLVPQPATG